MPTFYEARRRSKSASHHRSHTTADGSTTSSHLLARLVSSEEEVREINAVLAVTSERLEAESSRANAAERRALDYFHRLRIATENRERAEQESARLREELKLYKLQLENAQKEIFRAQDIIDQVSAQRNEAEADAARARTKARKLQEEKLVMFAREEGRRAGYREGLSMGRRVGYDQGRPRWLIGPSDQLPHPPLSLENYDGDDNDEDLSDNERNDPRSHIQLRSSTSIRHQPYVNTCVARSLLLIPITACVPGLHLLYVGLKRGRHFLSHRRVPFPSTRLLTSTVRRLHFANPMNQKPFARYPSTLAPPHPLLILRPLPTDGSREPILARHIFPCHPHTGHSHLFPPRLTSLRLTSRIGVLHLNQSQPPFHHLSEHAIMLISHLFRFRFNVCTRLRLHRVLRLIFPNMIW